MITEINSVINIAYTLQIEVKKRFVDEKNVIELIDNQDLDEQEQIQIAESPSNGENLLLKFSINQNILF